MARSAGSQSTTSGASPPPVADREVVAASEMRGSGRPFQLGRGLALVARALAEAEERGDGVEQAAGAGRHRRVDAATQASPARLVRSAGVKAATGARSVIARASSPKAA